MRPIDTHAHLQFEKFEIDRSEVIERNSSQLEAVINPGADLDSSAKAVELAAKVTNFYAGVGVHPHHVDNWNETYLPTLEKLLKEEKVVAVGEIGLDKHPYQGYPEPNIKKQIKILLPQIDLAQRYKKPILFHCREAYDELYETIKGRKPLKGLLHCFMGDKETANKFVNLGLYISFAGNLTYKNNTKMREAVKNLPDKVILVETDSPYLSPEGLRGQRNEPVNIGLIIDAIAQQKGISKQEVVNFTNSNAKILFDL